jgi:hypothetical protein
MSFMLSNLCSKNENLVLLVRDGISCRRVQPQHILFEHLNIIRGKTAYCSRTAHDNLKYASFFAISVLASAVLFKRGEHI